MSRASEYVKKWRKRHPNTYKKRKLADKRKHIERYRKDSHLYYLRHKDKKRNYYMKNFEKIADKRHQRWVKKNK